MPSHPLIVEQLSDLYRRHVRNVEALSVERLPGDASNRAYFRIRAGDDSAIAMVLAENDPHKAAEEISKECDTIPELPFVNVLRFLASYGIPVPRLLFDGQQIGVLILEDLGDLTLLEYAVQAAEDQRERIYAQAVDDLVALQTTVLHGDYDGFIGIRRRYDQDLLFWEFEHFVEYAIDSKGENMPQEERAMLQDAFHLLSDRIASMPQALVHRDYHSRNLMVRNGGLAIIDFQDALMGPVPYDLASLLRDSYISVGEPLVDRLVERYRLGAQDAGIGHWSRDEFRECFDIVSVQRNLKAAGRFEYIDQVKGNPKFLADIPRTLGYVKENIAKHESLKGLRVLANYVPMLA